MDYRKDSFLSDNITKLENIREYVNIILGCKALPEILYIDELIDDNDDYVIDRNKQLNLRKKLKLFNKF